MTPDLHEKAAEVDKFYRMCLTDNRQQQLELEHAEHAYRQAHATATLSATGTAADKKATADKATNAEMLRRNSARAAVKATEAALRYWHEEKRLVVARIYEERSELAST